MRVGPTRRARLLLASIVMVGSLLLVAGLAEACRPSDPNPSIQTVGGSYSTSFNPSPGANYYWKVYVPPGSPGGTSYLQVRTTGPACNVPEACTDVDLYVRKGAIPNDGQYDCRPFLWEANEACYFSSPGADWWYIRVYSYTDDPTNPNALVSLIVDHDGSENLAPQPVADAYLVDEDTTTMFDVLSNDSDPDLTRIPGATDELSVTSAGPTDLGQSVSVVSGQVQYDAAAGVSGMDAFSYSVSDGCGGSASAEVTVTVNARPVAEDDGPYLVDQDGPVLLLDGLLDNDSDAFYSTFSGPEEGAALRINEIVAPPGKGTATISGDGLTIAYDPTDTASGTDAFTYQVTDGRLNATATVTIDVNARPMASDDVPPAIPQDDPGTDLDVRGNDGDPFWSAGSGAVSFPTDLTVVQTTDPSPLGGTVEIIQGGTAVRYTPPPGAFGTDSFTYTLSDGRLADTATVTVTVEEAENQAPTAQDDASYSTPFETPLSVAAAGVLANDEDPEGDELRAILVDPPANAAPDSFLLRLDGSFEYTPAQDFFGQDTFTYQANDGTASSGVATVTITVGEPEPEPVPDASQSTLTADPAEIAADGGEASSGVILQVRDTEGQPYFDPAGPPPSLTSSHGTLTTPQHQADGVWTATLTCVEAGSATISATVEGEAVPGEPVVECLEPEPEDNGAPVADGQELNMGEDGSLPIALTATDPDGDDITFSLIDPVPSGLAGTAPALTYTPAADFCTPDDPVSFQFRARDPYGATGTATVTIDVQCLDDAPVAQDDAASVDAEGTVTIDVLQNDADADEAYGDTFALLPFPDGATSAEGGAIAVEDGQVTYTAPPGFASPPLDTFQYTVEDGAGLTSTATVMVTVIPPNRPPEAQDATMSIPQGASAEILLEATDDHDEAAALQFEVASPTDLGVPITSVGQSVAYTSPGDVCGVVDTFEFTVTDSEGLEDTGRVRLRLVCPQTADPAPAPHDQDVETALHPPRGATPIEATGGEHVTILVTPPRDAPAGATISYAQAGGPAILDAEWHPGEGRLVFVAPTPQPGQSIVQTLHFTLTLGDAASLPLIIDVVTHRADAVPVVVASASPAQAAAGAEVVLDASGSTHPLGLPLAFAWDQVSGMPVELPASDQATASFTAPAVPPGGSATLVFSVTAQAGGRSATEEVTVRVDGPTPTPAPAAPPSATFEAVPRGDGAILFRAEGDAAAKYEWDFGDGERAEGREVLHRFDQGGDFTVRLRVDDEAGSETASKDVMVADPVPVATAEDGTPLWAVLTVAAAGLLAVAVAGVVVVRASRRR